ncbi:MAG: PaaI family thioesterase [Flavobacteriaceae bacterium]|tara:strand:+ start:1908 stop:2336 length:429 start_codon:yes stop_codon:yes gene_type:complete
MKTDKNKILKKVNDTCKETLMGTLDMEFVDIGEDYITCKMPVNHKVHQPDGILHGGATLALAESVGSFASRFFINDPEVTVRGIELSANHLKSISKGDVYARASKIHLGRTTQLWEIKITDKENNLISLAKLTTIAIKKNKK